MAKTKTLRVHMLAKELGVASKEIIAKCKAEGIELKNHMAAITIGLAESIREWFSAGDDVTTVEFAQKVDLEKVRKRKPKPKKETKEKPPEEAAAEARSAEEAKAPRAPAEPTAPQLETTPAAPTEIAAQSPG
ncbi:MAG: hypothetical protein D6744_11370, partial [Planctomycetota bacterium]